MKNKKTIFLSILIVFIIFFTTTFKEEKILNTDRILKIGSGDDVTGLLLKEIIEINSNKDRSDLEYAEGSIFDFTFKDC